MLAYNFLSCIFMAARMYRVATIMQFFQSVGFAAISLALCFGWQATADSAVVGYGLASAFCIVGSYPFLKRVWQAAATELPARRAAAHFWAKLLPFAAWIWMSNLLSGLFDIIDRYMIVHFSGLEVDEALRQVGYYHTSRLLPLLFVAVSALLGSMITPHLSHDWELGRRREVAARLNTVLKALDLSLFAASVVVLICAPFLFNTVLGRQVHRRPRTASVDARLLHLVRHVRRCAKLFVVRRKSLAEQRGPAGRPGWSTSRSISCCSLASGLHGAVMATTAANFTALLLIYLLNNRLGMRIARGTWILAAVPMLLWLGPTVAVLGLLVVLAISLCTDWLFTDEERHHLLAPAVGVWQKIRVRLGRRIGAPAGETRMLANPCPNQPVVSVVRRIAGCAVAKANTNSLPLVDRGPLRVMFVITSMPVGGAETLLVDLIRRLDRSHFLPELCCLKELGPLGEVLAREIPTFDHLLVHKTDLRRVAASGRAAAPPSSRRGRHGRRRRQDVLGPAGRSLGTRAGCLFGTPFHRLARHGRSLESSAYADHRRVHRGGRVARQSFSSTSSHFPAAKVHVIPNGIDVEPVSPRRRSPGDPRGAGPDPHDADGRHRGGAAAGEKSRAAAAGRPNGPAARSRSGLFDRRRRSRAASAGSVGRAIGRRTGRAVSWARAATFPSCSRRSTSLC